MRPFLLGRGYRQVNFSAQQFFMNALIILRPLQPVKLKQMMSEVWESWFGGSMSEPDRMILASKLHPYISETSYYNFPHLFGYLFSVGIYSRKDSHGDAFFERYTAVLRDAGRMTARESGRETPES